MRQHLAAVAIPAGAIIPVGPALKAARPDFEAAGSGLGAAGPDCSDSNLRPDFSDASGNPGPMLAPARLS